MDLPPESGTPEYDTWEGSRARVVKVLEENGLRYFRFGRVLPQGQLPEQSAPPTERRDTGSSRPDNVEDLIHVLVRGLRRSMHPLTHRRKGTQPLAFTNEYDVQDLLHAMLRPWVSDIRPEEFTPSYAGSSTRMDFLLPAHSIVIELKVARDPLHAKRIGDELIVDIAHYQRHPDCRTLWCVVYDPNHFVTNADGLRSDLDGRRTSKEGEVFVRVMILAG